MIHAAASPVTADVTTTPSVESASAGFHAARIDENGVCRPPSNRISASAMLPMRLASA